jgi:hypothetical protein
MSNVDKYIKKGGMFCLQCKAKTLLRTKLIANGDIYKCITECGMCGRRWRDVFRLAAIEEVDPHMERPKFLR